MVKKKISKKRKIKTETKISKKLNNSLSLLAPQNQKMLEAKYCSCLRKVSSSRKNKKAINNPYGICTQAVFSSRGSVRDKVVDCSSYYDFSKMTLAILKKKAKENGIKKYSKMNKRELVKNLSQNN